MSLTPTGSRYYEDPFFGDEDPDAVFGDEPSFYDDWPAYRRYADGGYEPYPEDVEAETNACYPVYDVEYEIKEAWEDYEDAEVPVKAKGALLPLIAFENLDKRLAAMAWLQTTRYRRPNPKRSTRNGRRYKVVQDHGTAAGREGIELMHQRRADLHDNGLYWRDARRKKAIHRRNSGR